VSFRAVGPAVIALISAIAVDVHAVIAQGAASEPAGGLAPIQALADSGQTTEARSELEAWLASAASRTAVEISWARLLRARLSADPESAEVDYVWVAIEGDAAHAPEALLRLAQLRLMRGEPNRALADLDQLRASFPANRRAEEAWLWIGHAHEALGELDAACGAWERASGENPVSGGAVREVMTVCADAGDVFAVQVGAFGAAAGAETIRRRLEEAGYPAYVVAGTDDDLHRVRTGRFAHVTSAARFADRVRGSGFEAVVVLAERT
jgi:tetratricopeptide (TPR) repeat protein